MFARLKRRLLVIVADGFFIIGGLILGPIFLTAPFGMGEPGQYAQNITFFFMGIVFILHFFNVFITGRHFDRQFKEQVRNDYLAQLTFNLPGEPSSFLLASHFFRAGLYSHAVVFRNVTKKNRVYRSMFQGYDFRANARRIDIICSFLFAISVYIMGVLLVVGIIIPMIWGWIKPYV